MTAVFRHFDSIEDIHESVFELLAGIITDERNTPYALMIAGGSTPLKVYNQISQSELTANQYLTLMFSDDRHLPADSPDSNYGNCLPMIKRLGLEDRTLHIDAGVSLDDAAESYANQIDSLLSAGAEIKLALLGMGADGHTASIFSEEDARRRDCTAFPVYNTGGFNRVSVSTPILEKASKIVFLVTGESKAAILKDFRNNPLSLPSGIATADHKAVEIWTDLSPEALI